MRRWRDEEIRFLVENYKKMPYREIAERLGRSYEAVRAKIIELRKKGFIGLKVEKSEWTHEEIKVLSWLYGKIPTRDLRDYFLKDKSLSSIRQKAHALGLKFNRTVLGWMKFEKGSNVKRAEIIKAIMDLGGVATSNELYGLFEDKITRVAFRQKLWKMVKERVIKSVRLTLGATRSRGGIKYRSHQLVDGLSNVMLYYIDEDDLYNYLVGFLGDDLSPDMPQGKKVAMTAILRRCLPESVFRRIRERYVRNRKSKDYVFGH